LQYIVDAIAELESNNITLDFDYGLIDHAKDIVNFRAKEFDKPIYYLAFFLNPKFRKVAVSKKLTFNNI
ncbi:1803_t:CDS:2, partial [Scutellospora calospora]